VHQILLFHQFIIVFLVRIPILFIWSFSTVESHKVFFCADQSFSLTSFKFNQTWVENWTKSYEIEFKRNSPNYCSLSLWIKLSIIDRYLLSFISESQTTSYDHQLMVRTGNKILSNNISLPQALPKTKL
jgi:hypothetical protein